MRLKGFLITIVIILSLVFAILNWQVLTTNVPLNLIFFKIDFPLGLGLLISGVLLSLLFFIVSLIDRAGQLRQISRLERQLVELRHKLEQKRLQELERLEKTTQSGFSELKKVTTEKITETGSELKDLLNVFDSKLSENLKVIESKILLLRNELTSTVAKSEHNLKKQVKEIIKS